MAQRASENPIVTTTGGRRPAELTWDIFQAICIVLSVTGAKYRSCEQHGFTYKNVQAAIRSAYDKGDEEWRELWDTSYAQFQESLEQAAIRRHVDGVPEPVFNQKGQQVGTRIVYSDRLGEVLIKGHFPERYREKITAAGSIGLEPIDAFANLTIKAKREIRAIIMRDLEEQRQAAKEVDDLSANMIDAEFTEVGEEGEP